VSLPNLIAGRFRGFLPVVVDLETGGFDSDRHAVLELAGVFLHFDGTQLTVEKTHHNNIAPSEGLEINPQSLSFTGIDPYNPLRAAVSEADGFRAFFGEVRRAVKATGCTRAILVAHNAAFDQQFINAAATRNGLKRNPFHPFSFIDTASLAALAFGHTVLREACDRAGIDFDEESAHAALYDAEKTAALFCEIVNRWQMLGGWPVKGRLESLE
jgi:ribonuclease T